MQTLFLRCDAGGLSRVDATSVVERALPRLATVLIAEVLRENVLAVIVRRVSVHFAGASTFVGLLGTARPVSPQRSYSRLPEVKKIAVLQLLITQCDLVF